MREFSGRDISLSQSAKAVLATANWAVSLTLLVAVSIGDLPLVCAAWSIICAIWGGTFVVWALLVRERLALERLADIAADVYGKSTALHSVR